MKNQCGNAYIDPAEAEKARELGQQKFQEGDWPGAVDAFTERSFQ
jgi:stress-induced-phosphoprotein 1